MLDECMHACMHVCMAVCVLMFVCGPMCGDVLCVCDGLSACVCGFVVVHRVYVGV